MESLGGQGIEVALSAPDEVAAQVRFGVLTGRALEAARQARTASRSWSASGPREEGAEAGSAGVIMS